MEKMRQWSLLSGLAVVGVLAAGWFLLISPQRAHAKDLGTQAAAQQSSAASVQSQVQQLKQQQKGEPAQQRKLMQIAAQIPDNPQLPALIRELSTAAHDSGVSLESLAPSQPMAVVSTTPTGGTTAAGSTAAASPLAQIPITIQVTGSYFNIETFFRSIEHLDRAMLVAGFTVSPGASGSSTNTTTGVTSGTDALSAAPATLNGQIQAVVFESPAIAAATATTPQTAAPATTESTAPAQSTTGSTTTPAQSATSGQ
jgi:Tfp pilus assembly protein PilO